MAAKWTALVGIAVDGFEDTQVRFSDVSFWRILKNVPSSAQDDESLLSSFRAVLSENVAFTHPGKEYDICSVQILTDRYRWKSLDRESFAASWRGEKGIKAGSEKLPRPITGCHRFVIPRVWESF